MFPHVLAAAILNCDTMPDNIVGCGLCVINRWTYLEFFQRYRVLAHSKEIRRNDMRKTCEQILLKLIQVKGSYVNDRFFRHFCRVVLGQQSKIPGLVMLLNN